MKFRLMLNLSCNQLINVYSHQTQLSMKRELSNTEKGVAMVGCGPWLFVFFGLLLLPALAPLGSFGIIAGIIAIILIIVGVINTSKVKDDE